MGVSVDITNFALWSIILVLAGSIVGNISHMVKKRVEDGEDSELSAFQKWVWGRPFTTAGALIAGISTALAVSPPTATTGTASDLVRLFVQSAAMGFASDSLINRPKNGNGTKKDPDSV